jgi:hypothetical protein
VTSFNKGEIIIKINKPYDIELLLPTKSQPMVTLTLWYGEKEVIISNSSDIDEEHVLMIVNWFHSLVEIGNVEMFGYKGDDHERG